MKFLFPFLPLYVAPFAVLFAMPRWRWLLPAAFVAAGGVWWLWREAHLADGPGSFVAPIVAGVITLGFAGGALARIVLLFLGRRGKTITANIALGLLVLVAVPAGVLWWAQARRDAVERRWEPPSLACRSRIFDTTLGATKLRVPLIPGITLGQGSDLQTMFTFGLPQQARKFCAEATTAPVAITVLSIDFARDVAFEPQRRQKPLCDRTRQEAWWPALCRFDPTRPPAVLELHLFDKERFNAGKMFAWDADRGPFYRTYQPDLRWAGDGVFERVDDDGQIHLRSKSWPAAESTYHARCHQQTDAGLYCVAGETLASGPGLVYEFRAAESSLEQDARSAGDYARSLALSFGVK